MNKYILFFLSTFITNFSFAENGMLNSITGTVKSSSGEPLDYVSVYIKGTHYACFSDEKGRFTLDVPRGKQELVFSLLGFRNKSVEINVAKKGESQTVNVVLEESSQELSEVEVRGKSAVRKVNESAFNAVAIDVKALHNTTGGLSDALAKAPGIKLRESGGVGSDMKLSLDGFSGRHVKIFIDGVPQEGAGASFGINNIPVNFAERIEIYRGVVPVEFGSDALGGVINIVTIAKGNRRRTFADVSYSYGSFNTHKSHINVGHTAKNGFTVELNAFQNYSDNSYYVYTSVKEFTEHGDYIDTDKIEKAKRFHDTYHNEAVIAKVGVVGKKYADRLLLSVNLSQSDKEIQNGVEQTIVFGQKRRKSDSFMPSLEYRKRNLFVKGLDMNLTANYNRNQTHNLDTATYLYNWRGESKYNNGKLGEQSYQNARSNNDNWNGTLNVRYRIGDQHTLSLNHVLTAFTRKTLGNSETQSASSAMDKVSQKNITGLSYHFNYDRKWNISLFGKYYNQFSEGPRNESAESGSYNYVQFSETADAWGYGAAGTYFFLKNFQTKISYEKALRLPTTDELFGDEDLELGSMNLKPERSDNFNASLSYNADLKKHAIYVEGGFLYRDTKDYIRRVTNKFSGGLFYASHENHGRVKTIGLNAELRYTYSNLFSVGGNLTSQNIRDYEKYVTGGSLQQSSTYKVRIPNMPYFFFNTDAAVYFHNLFGKGNTLTLTYANFFVNEFPLYWENHGNSTTKMRVPNQFSHDISLAYSIKNGRYNLSFECRNFTNERLYDNFNLQKAGRAFYGKFRYYLSK
ncbi:TonB-dependent receptor [Paludibacter sp. 221]|uniref:TonB-dependent receptor n=1 Tax=Paludibacter sp. 221 TaxID=2302939 RepID=UPI0013D46248|nr:TonB-dependent receptor [Paludibacter sp. 221]NDV45886.1 TonB-dependent receptor [Paludibacter sp. 221]